MNRSEPLTAEGIRPDWARVARAVYQVRQHYRYSYTGPVTDLKQRLMMIPPDRHGDQRLLASQLDVRGASARPRILWETDSFGNRYCQVLVERVEHALDFEVSYRVERVADGELDSVRAAASPLAGEERRRDYLKATALTAPDDRLRAAARVIARRSPEPRVRAELAHDWAASAICYQFGVTGVQTPAAMALHLGKGVCQDYAHILIGVLRLLGVPARYVSGHLLGEGAPHAWVEALCDNASTPAGLQVIAFDPTHHRTAGLNYITVAVGRDFADVTPTSGYFSGAAQGRLSWSKQAEIAEIAYREGADARESAA